jgi:FAD/FMN-containing dehydrogenase
VETAFIAVPSPLAALDLLALVQEKTGGAATTFELMARIAVEFSFRHGGHRDPLPQAYRWYVLLELSSTQEDGLRDLMFEALEAGYARRVIVDAAVADSLEQRASLWRLRESLSEVQKFEGGSIKHDVSVPLARVPDFLTEAATAAVVLIPGCRPWPFGHLGDGNIHFNVSQPIGADKDAFLARWRDMNEVVHAVARKHGGSISAEHGIGVLKRDELAQVKDPVALAVMRALKRTLDPNNILNPGKVV